MIHASLAWLGEEKNSTTQTVTSKTLQLWRSWAEIPRGRTLSQEASQRLLPPYTFRFLTSVAKRGDRETRVTGDEAQGTMGETSGNEAEPAMSGIVKRKEIWFCFRAKGEEQRFIDYSLQKVCRGIAAPGAA